MLYNVVLVSAVQQSESVIHTHISLLFWIFLIRLARYLSISLVFFNGTVEILSIVSRSLIH